MEKSKTLTVMINGFENSGVDAERFSASWVCGMRYGPPLLTGQLCLQKYDLDGEALTLWMPPRHLSWRLSEMSDHLYRSQFVSLQGINGARFYWKLSAFRFTDIWVELVPLISQMGTKLWGRNAKIKNKSWWSNPAKLFQNNHFKDLERRFVLSRSTSMRGSAIKPNFLAKYAWRPDHLSV